MDAAQDLKDEIQDGFDGKSPSKVAEAAAKLTPLCEREEQLWTKAKVAEAIRLATENLQASKELEAAARTGNLDSSAKAFERLNASCRACHDLHLEKAHRSR
jgi:cytochrome c556